MAKPPLAARLLAPLCAALLLFAASGPTPAAGQAQGEGRAAELAAVARDLAARGEALQAVALVQAELDPTVDPAPRSTLLFTLGWLEHQLADQDRARRMQHLE